MLFTCLLFLVCFRVNCVYSQATRRLSIPILKENPVVDSILNAILDNHLAPTIGKKFTYKWLNFEIHLKGRGRYHFSAFPANKSQINWTVNRFRNTKTRFGYFSYQNVFVFVTSNDNFSSFYKTTQKVTLFDFLHVLKSPKPTRNIVTGNIEFWDYDYENGNGKFTASKIPIIR